MDKNGQKLTKFDRALPGLTRLNPTRSDLTQINPTWLKSTQLDFFQIRPNPDKTQPNPMQLISTRYEINFELTALPSGQVEVFSFVC